jgi:acyl-CoA thioester hydrolase
MSDFKFYIPIQVRYGDLDAQWHVNHTRFLTYMEQARMEYVMHLGLFDGQTFLDLRAIVADAHITYLAPIMLGQNIRVGTCTKRIGNKSIVYEYSIEDSDSGQVLATGAIVSVAYNFRDQKSIPVPEEWRKRISAFEGKEF